MKRSTREALEAYYQEAGSWAADREDALRKSRRTAWIVAAAAVTAAVIEAFALMLLAPLKTVVPYTLLVDRTTGYVQALKPIEAETIAPQAALTQSFLVQYVVARESFDIDDLQAAYAKVTLWSAEQARADYVTKMQASNPASPLARLPRSTIVETRVKSVSALGDSAALVRFDTQRHDAGGQTAPPRAYVAVIRYRFSTGPLRTADRYINPLGFQVVRYQLDPETLPPASPAQAQAAATLPATAASRVIVPGWLPAGSPLRQTVTQRQGQ